MDNCWDQRQAQGNIAPDNIDSEVALEVTEIEGQGLRRESRESDRLGLRLCHIEAALVFLGVLIVTHLGSCSWG
jgi:hypothetical protein